MRPIRRKMYPRVAAGIADETQWHIYFSLRSWRMIRSLHQIIEQLPVYDGVKACRRRELIVGCQLEIFR